MQPTSYHSSDFDYEEWALQATSLFHLPDPCAPPDEAQSEQWGKFFRCHTSGAFFKPRNYLFEEFKTWFYDLISTTEGQPRILEVGSGHGCSMFPLLNRLPTNVNYIATDFSSEALGILRNQSEYVESQVETREWDIVQAAPAELLCSVPIVLAVFVLSAIHPSNHFEALKNVFDVLLPNSVLLFRDYAAHDMTMYRHKNKLDNFLFLRTDGTLAYYFTKEYLITLATSVGFEVSEISYACVTNSNRKKAISMNRVFLHCVLKKG